MVREWLHQGAGILEVRFYLWCDLSARVHFDWYSLDQIHFPVPGVNGSYTKILPGLFGRGEFFCAEKVLFGDGAGRTSSLGRLSARQTHVAAAGKLYQENLVKAGSSDQSSCK